MSTPQRDPAGADWSAGLEPEQPPQREPAQSGRYGEQAGGLSPDTPVTALLGLSRPATGAEVRARAAAHRVIEPGELPGVLEAITEAREGPAVECPDPGCPCPECTRHYHAVLSRWRTQGYDGLIRPGPELDVEGCPYNECQIRRQCTRGCGRAAAAVRDSAPAAISSQNASPGRSDAAAGLAGPASLPPVVRIVAIHGERGRFCTCAWNTPCPLGRTGAELRCRESELRAAGVQVEPIEHHELFPRSPIGLKDAGAPGRPSPPCCARVGDWWCVREQGHGGECEAGAERGTPPDGSACP